MNSLIDADCTVFFKWQIAERLACCAEERVVRVVNSRACFDLQAGFFSDFSGSSFYH
jgi:hypothetical protein